ncbi:hypothetical protein V6N13_048803 [Hibiscus sabdariffa]
MSVVRDVTVVGHNLTKDALHHIMTHVVDILTSLSLAITRKMVDDVESEGEHEGEEPRQDDHQLSEKHTFVFFVCFNQTMKICFVYSLLPKNKV